MYGLFSIIAIPAERRLTRQQRLREYARIIAPIVVSVIAIVALSLLLSSGSSRAAEDFGETNTNPYIHAGTAAR